MCEDNSNIAEKVGLDELDVVAGGTADTGTAELDGVVVDALSNTEFEVRLEDGRIVHCIPSGKLRLNHISIFPGNRVTVKMAPYDSSRGHIIWRSKW